MPISFHDLVGTVGVSLILFCYFMLQIGKMHSQQLCYILVNLLGASLVVFSLYFEFNFSAMLLEGIWMLISLIGLYRYYRSKSDNVNRAQKIDHHS